MEHMSCVGIFYAMSILFEEDMAFVVKFSILPIVNETNNLYLNIKSFAHFSLENVLCRNI